MVTSRGRATPLSPSRPKDFRQKNGYSIGKLPKPIIDWVALALRAARDVESVQQRALCRFAGARSLLRRLLLLIVVLGLLITSCAPVRPVAKIGLLASFEGLHRRSGYEALVAMRLAIRTAATQSDSLHTVALLPLALDAGSNPEQARRSAKKLLADPAVKAIIGPYDPATVEAVRPIIEAAQIPWYSPFTLDPTVGMVPVTASPAWATALVTAVATAAKAQGQERLVLLGPSAGWPSMTDLVAADAPLPIVAVDLSIAGVSEPAIYATDALFWLASPESSTIYIEELRPTQPDVPFWLGPWGSDPVWAERTASHTELYWVSWVDDGYPRWRREVPAQGVPNSPTAYLTYRATEAALATIETVSTPAVPTWRSQRFALQNDGSSSPLEPLQP